MDLAAPRPPAESLRDDNGQTRPSWQLYFTQQAEFQRASATGLTQAQSSAVQAQAGANAAQTNATAAAVAAADAKARLDALLSSPPIWVIGDYRETVLASLGANWLLCDGSDFNTTTYPNLEAALSGITSPGGGGAGTRKLPSIPPVYDVASPSGPPVRQTFIKAL